MAVHSLVAVVVATSQVAYFWNILVVDRMQPGYVHWRTGSVGDAEPWPDNLHSLQGGLRT